MKHWTRMARGFMVLAGLGLAAMIVARSSAYLDAVARVSAVTNGQVVHQGHFVNENLSDVPWTLTPALAAGSGGEKLRFSMAETPYTPSSAEGLDDYHCFLVDPKFVRDGFVTGVNILPGNAKVVHHVILFKIEGDAIKAALEKDKQTSHKGWTCFGGPNVGGLSGGNWLGAWVPGAGNGDMPAGVGVAVKKGSLLVMQMHYNLSNGSGPDNSSAELTLAPEGAQLKALRSSLTFAPVEIPCADGLKTVACQRDTTLAENAKKFGPNDQRIPGALLLACNQTLADYQKPVGDASRITTSCARPVSRDATLYSIAGHMHLRGVDIKIELNPGTAGAKTLLHIPKWDFHWQGNYWFRTPVEVKKDDIIKLSCVFDNSTANQPLIGDAPATPRYITWGEGTADEMCLGIAMAVPK